MSTETLQIDRVTDGDLPAVETLLTAAHLPLDGLAAAFEHGVVAREEGAIAGAAAVEIFGEAGLLRSVVVDPALRGTGVGRSLVAAAEDLARSTGVRDLYLLTETAVDYFPRLGYVRVDRSEVPATVAASVEFATACPVSAIAMLRRL